MPDILPVNTDNPNQVLPGSSPGMTRKVIKGSFWVLIGQVLPLVATFASTPFVIRFLGSESYGVLILVGVIAGYFSFADFGMGLASTKFGSEAYANNKPDEEGLVVRTAATIGIFSSMFIAIPMFVFSRWIVADVLKVPVHLIDQASTALKISSVAFVMSFVGNIFNTPQLSRMRMDLNVLVTAGPKILMIIITPIVLYYGGGIVEATIVAFLAAAFIMLGNLFVSGGLLPQLYARSISKKKIKPLLKFGGNIVLYGIGLAIINNFEKLLLTRYVSVQSLAYYSVAFTFANMTTMFSMAMVQTLIPAFSQLLAPEYRIQLQGLFSRSVRICLLGLLPSVIFLLAIAKPFFTLWAGKDFGEQSVYPFYILLIGIFFSIMVYIPNCILLASGRPDIFSRFYLIEILPYIALTYLLISSFGILGAALAWTIKEILNALIFIRFTRKFTGVHFDFGSQVTKMAISVMLLSPPAVFAILIDPFSVWVYILCGICLIIYFWYAWKKLITYDERIWLAARLPFKVKL